MAAAEFLYLSIKIRHLNIFIGQRSAFIAANLMATGTYPAKFRM